MNPSWVVGPLDAASPGGHSHNPHDREPTYRVADPWDPDSGTRNFPWVTVYPRRALTMNPSWVAGP